MKNEENTRMKKFKGCIIYFTLALMTIILCSCNKQHDKITLSEPTLNKISEIEKQYGVTINYCNVPIEENIKFEYEIASNANEIAEAVEAAEIIFSRLPDNWTEELIKPELDTDMVKEINNVNIVFCEELESEIIAFGNEISLGGLYASSGDTFYLMADIHNYEPEQSIADAVINRLVNMVKYDDDIRNKLNADNFENVEVENQTIFTYYADCNPENFEYSVYNGTTNEEYKNYVYSKDTDVEDIYFINEESMYCEQLDCRYIIGPLLYTDEDEELSEAFNSPHIQKKYCIQLGVLIWFFGSRDIGTGGLKNNHA